ncbi:MAG: hypothetical protein QOD94_2366 [Alphaproteobacteria bacterium]|jgi:hypothetical protein|nr:hypothetical protein [Alphaproteobacteria bacterium]
MALTSAGIIALPHSRGTKFDHGAFDPKSRRVFVAHTARDSVEIIDVDTRSHVATLAGFPEAAGVAADEGCVLVTNRGAASLAWLDADTLQTRAVLKTAPRPNGVAIVTPWQVAVVACLGDQSQGPELQIHSFEHEERWSIELPGAPRWCVVDAKRKRVFLAIRDPSMVLVASLPKLEEVQHWLLPAQGAHGMDINHGADLLYVACDGGSLVEIDSQAGTIRREWPLAGVPDATFFNPASGLVHVAISDPGLIESIDPAAGRNTRFATARGAKTTALIVPDRLYVFSPLHEGVLDLVGA